MGYISLSSVDSPKRTNSLPSRRQIEVKLDRDFHFRFVADQNKDGSIPLDNPLLCGFSMEL